MEHISICSTRNPTSDGQINIRWSQSLGETWKRRNKVRATRARGQQRAVTSDRHKQIYYPAVWGSSWVARAPPHQSMADRAGTVELITQADAAFIGYDNPIN
ncbi:hypothetical protein ACJJTC_012444 [Scirpophaga incertulas]